MRRIKKIFNRFIDNYLTRLLLKNINPTDIKKSGYIFIFNQVKSKFTGKIYILISHELAKLKIPSIFKYKNDLIRTHYPRLFIDDREISNTYIAERRFIIKSLYDSQLSFKWDIDVENERMVAEGINFFPIIRNTLRTIQKRYNVIFHDDNKMPVYSELVQSCDILLKDFLLLQDYSQKTGKKIRLVGFESEYVPNGILRLLCEQLSQDRDIEYIELRRGYISYFGKHHHRASYIACRNLTRAKADSGLFVSKEELAAFNQTHLKEETLLQPISSAIEKQISSKTSVDRKNVIEKIEWFKSNGKKIFVLFPHVFYDTPLDDKSAVFKNMCEWIAETVKYFKSNENLLLIKPHPAEFIKDQPKRTPTETLTSFLKDTELSENIIILERDAFTVKDLSPLISCGLIWRSSVAMELAFLGIRHIIAGNPIYMALDLNYAKNRENYFRMIENSDTIKITDKQKMDVAKYLYLLENEHVHVSCIKYNQELRNFYWSNRELKKYLRAGDEKINSVVEKMMA